MAPRIIEIKEDGSAEIGAIRRLTHAAEATGDDVISAVAATRYHNLTKALPDESTSRLLGFDRVPRFDED